MHQDDFFEIPDVEPCPCGSSKSYLDCCKRKGIVWGHTNGQIIRKIAINQPAQEILQLIASQFEDLYGRNPLPHERFLAFSPISEDSIRLELLYHMRKAGLDEEKIYATFMSGLIPSEINLKNIPDGFLDEFYAYRKEYRRLLRRKPKGGKVPRLQYCQTTNVFLEKAFHEICSMLVSTIYGFIGRHATEEFLKEVTVRTPIEYAIFSLLKVSKILQSIDQLLDQHLTESIIALSRGLFESYTYFNAINRDTDFFRAEILQEEGGFQFESVHDGEERSKQSIVYSEKKRKRRLRFYELRKYFTIEADNMLYSLFYETACQYVHTDILSAKAYFYAVNPYDEIDPCASAAVIAIALVALLIKQASIVTGVEEQYRQDYLHLFSKIKTTLLTAFQLVNADPEQKNVIFDILVARFEAEKAD